jgi:hypothetical protein
MSESILDSLFLFNFDTNMEKMEKNLIIYLITFFISNQSIKSQIALETNAIIEGYIGGPNITDIFNSPIYQYKTTTINNVNTPPLIGMKIEYFVGDNIGIGGNIFYNRLIIDYTNQETINSAETNYTTVSISENLTKRMDRLRVQAFFNYHFEIDNPFIDLYWSIGAGYNSRKFTYTSGNIQFDDTQDESRPTLTFPVSVRTNFGFRYFPIQNLGINVELGLGGPLVSAGIAYRLLGY